MPSMNSVFVTIAPAMEAFTRTYCPARNAVRAMISSVRFPSVAFSRPPIVSPVLAAIASVARTRRARRAGRWRGLKAQTRVVSLRLDGPSGEQNRDERKQPEQAIVTNFLEQRLHRTVSKGAVRPHSVCLIQGPPAVKRGTLWSEAASRMSSLWVPDIKGGRQPDEHFRMRPTGRLEHPCLDAIRPPRI